MYQFIYFDIHYLKEAELLPEEYQKYVEIAFFHKNLAWPRVW